MKLFFRYLEFVGIDTNSFDYVGSENNYYNYLTHCHSKQNQLLPHLGKLHFFRTDVG